MKAGIYKIKNLITGMVYIGSSVNVNHRISEHKWKLRTGKHNNGKLLNSWRKYGDSAFVFGAIELFENIEQLPERERYWMGFYNSIDPEKGYNILIQPYSGKRVINNCSNCNIPSNPLRRGLCHACDTYKTRKGSDRPYITDGRASKVPAGKKCFRCKRKLNIKGNAGNGLCKSCYRVTWGKHKKLVLLLKRSF